MSGYVRAYSESLREATANLDENSLRLYIALLSYANCQGKCWPGIKALVSGTGLSTDAVYLALQALVERNYVIVVRKGVRDVETGMQMPNVYKIAGAVIDDEDCLKTEQMYNPILEPSSTQESKHHHRTDSINTIKETQPETPPPTQPIPSNVEVPKPNTTAETKTAKTPTRSVNTNSPDRVPRNFYSGTLAEFATPLAAEDEHIAAELRSIDARLTIRMARYLTVVQGAAHAKWAIAHYRKQTNVFNPAGYLRCLIERQAVEEVDAAQIDPNEEFFKSWAPYVDN